jgi:hypothetical protein
MMVLLDEHSVIAKKNNIGLNYFYFWQNIDHLQQVEDWFENKLF